MANEKKKPTTGPSPATPNREQRRREKFGRAGKVHQHNPTGPWPESEANPALRTATGEVVPPAGAPDGDVTDQPGPGASGATKKAARPPAREGAKTGPKPKG